MARARKAGLNYFMYMGDATKAFDKINRNKINISTKAHLKGIRHIARIINKRHMRIIDVTKIDGNTSKYK